MNGTNVRLAAGIAAGAAGLGIAAGAHLMMRHGIERREQQATAEWTAWERELDAEFPKVGSGPDGTRRPLFDQADEQRFTEFLADHPAPEWLNVKHENLRAISIDPFEPRGTERNWTGIAGGVLGIGGGFAMGFTGARMLERAGSAGSTLGLALNVAGATLGLGSIAGMFLLPKSTLHDDIKLHEWNVPTHWSE